MEHPVIPTPKELIDLLIKDRFLDQYGPILPYQIEQEVKNDYNGLLGPWASPGSTVRYQIGIYLRNAYMLAEVRGIPNLHWIEILN